MISMSGNAAFIEGDDLERVGSADVSLHVADFGPTVSIDHFSI